MKKIFLMLFLTTLFFSCKDDKEKDPSPELAAQVAGNYKVSKLTVDGTELPLELVKAEVIVQLDKFSAEVVTGRMKMKIDGVSEPDEDFGTLTLKNAGSTGVDLYEATTKVGNVDKSNKLSMYVEFEGSDYEIIAQKQ
jgi:hypothetical protein